MMQFSQKVTFGTLLMGDVSFEVDAKNSSIAHVIRTGKSEEAIQKTAKLWGVLCRDRCVATDCYSSAEGCVMTIVVMLSRSLQ